MAGGRLARPDCYCQFHFGDELMMWCNVYKCLNCVRPARTCLPSRCAVWVGIAALGSCSCGQVAK